MKLIVEDIWTYIDGTYPKGLLDPVTSFRPDGYWFTPAFKKGWSDGYVRFVKQDSATKLWRFPTGFLARVLTLLEEKEWRYQVSDLRTYEPVEPVYELFDGNGEGRVIRLDTGKYSYQAAAVDAMLSSQRGIIHAGTGAGKTTLAAAAIKSINQNTLWLTHRTNLLYQTQRRIANHLGTPVGILGDSVCDIRKVTIAMVQSTANVLKDPDRNPSAHEYVKSCGCVIADEGHRLEGREFYNTFQEVPARWRFILTATPRLEQEGLYLLAHTGSVIYRITPQQLIESGVLVKPRIYFVKYDQELQPKKTPWQQAYVAGVVQNQARNAATAGVAQAFAAESKPTLLLVHRIEHGKVLQGLIEARGVKTAFIHGKVSQTDRDRIFEKLWVGQYQTVIAIASTVGEGTDLPKLLAVINATGTKGGGDSSDGDTGRDTIQMLGRGLRSSPGKSKFDYVDFVDTSHKTLTSATSARVNTLEEQGYSQYIKYWSEYVPDDVVQVT